MAEYYSMWKGEQIDHAVGKALGDHLSAPIVITGILEANNWTGDFPPYSYILEDQRITENSDIVFGPSSELNADQLSEWVKCGIFGHTQNNGSITIRALSALPIINIPISMKVYLVN